MTDAPRGLARDRAGRDPEPTAAGTGSQPVRTTETAGPSGYGAGRKARGRRRHIAVDVEGNPIVIQAHTADARDRDGAPEVILEMPGKHPCLESSPDPAFFPFFFSGFRVRLSRTFPQRSPQAAPSGRAEAPAGETPAGLKVIRFRAGRTRSGLPSGGGRRPVLPHPAVAEKGAGGHDQPAHDGDGGDPVGLSPPPEAIVQFPHVRGAPAGRQRGHIDDVPRTSPPAADCGARPSGCRCRGRRGPRRAGMRPAGCRSSPAPPSTRPAPPR